MNGANDEALLATGTDGRASLATSVDGKVPLALLVEPVVRNDGSTPKLVRQGSESADEALLGTNRG